MIQKNKFIFKFIYGVLVDEECESAKIISKQDLSKLVKSLENTATKNINITPDLSQVSQSNDDIFIVLNDVELTQADIGKIKNLLRITFIRHNFGQHGTIVRESRLCCFFSYQCSQACF